MDLTNVQALLREPGFLMMAAVHERAFRYGETDRWEAQFRDVVSAQFGTDAFRVEMRPHYDPLLNSVGDRLMVAFQVLY